MVDIEELPQVIVGTCGCLLPTDSKPAGFRFVLTPTGDKRVAVYCCAEHNRLGAPSPSAEPVPVKALKNKRSRGARLPTALQGGPRGRKSGPRPFKDIAGQTP